MEDHQQECARDGMDFLRKNTKRSWKNTKSKEIDRAKISAKVNLAKTSDYTETGDGEIMEQASAWTKAFDGGKFVRKSSEFRDKFSLEGDFGFESKRYHLYISHACPWAHRTLITRNLLGLHNHISYDVVDWRMSNDGSWNFNREEPGATEDTINERNSLEDIYEIAYEGWKNSRKIGTVPVLWDKKYSTIVNNESREIVRMFDDFARAGFGNGETLCPKDLRNEIDEMITANYESVNNGVYKSGFARTQEAYNNALDSLFQRLDELEEHLSGRDWLVGEGKGILTEADICLFTTLVRFDLVYVVHFKCNLRRIIDYPNLTGFLKRMLAIDEVKKSCNWDHIKNHYFWSHENINPYRIIPGGPVEGPQDY